MPAKHQQPQIHQCIANISENHFYHLKRQNDVVNLNIFKHSVQHLARHRAKYSN